MEPALNPYDRERYRRQLMLRGFTERHQQRLKQSTALVAGVGGLGGTAALYLAAAGIGRLILVHAGSLTLSNMNRQILMKSGAVGASRVVTAKSSIEAMNPGVQIEIHDTRIRPDTIGRLLGEAGIALSARPNFDERRVLNSACIEGDLPMVEAAMNGMEGYLFNVVPKGTPCLHCIYPEDDPSWQELGFPVLGAVSGMLGCMMAIEAIKLLTGYGTPLRSEMLVFSAEDMEFRKVKTMRNEACEICGMMRERRLPQPASGRGNG